MHVLPGEEEYRWLAKQRPHHKQQNRILLLNGKRKSLPRTRKATLEKVDDIILPQHEVGRYAN